MSRLIKYQPELHKDQEKTKVIQVRTWTNSVSNAEDLVDSSAYEERQRIIEHAEQEAKAIITNAERQKHHMLQEIDRERLAIEDEKKSVLEKAYEDGFQKGVRDGKESGFLEYESLIDLAKRVTDDSKTAFTEYVEKAEETILELAVAVAERILHSSLDEDKDKFIPLVQHALKEAREYKEVQIHVHPANYEQLLAEKAGLDAIFPNGIKCFIYPDAQLAEYSCVIESENGKIDATISTQLVELRGKLKQLLLEGEAE
ncbi:flagellar assembly protein FliH [Bacillus sp. FJAT-50079]|uniref:flagellar assembly protein FliH n=1 Tax=Bacillus sp. FJAT-50079 TaxID=2833577 RepID=UPI001BCA3663|nr:flagellar assembly protein FliH [Bacillus sp. FJAT-50079]MBS4207625.1 flagellar assembly protein FliH [Bacillus sp. FJAT-50079]